MFQSNEMSKLCETIHHLPRLYHNRWTLVVFRQNPSIYIAKRERVHEGVVVSPMVHNAQFTSLANITKLNPLCHHLFDNWPVEISFNLLNCSNNSRMNTSGTIMAFTNDSLPEIQ